MTSLADCFPPLGLTITAGPLELRPITDELIPDLVDLALAGIHSPDFMPFEQPWTDALPAELPANTARFYWHQRAAFTPADWTLNFAVVHEGELVGTQGAGATSFIQTRTVTTGSWLGLAHQGRGIGTLMRQTVAAFCFDHLDAERLVSGAFVDNPSSLAVSRKVGYVPNGLTVKARRGEQATHQELLLTPDRLVRHPYPLHVDGLGALRHFLGLDA